MDLTEGSIFKKLVKFTIPIMIIQFLNQAYSIVDNVIVARFVNETALSVVSTVNSALLVGYCIMQGIAGAVTILVGNLYGAKQYETLRKTVRTLLFWGTLISIVVFLIYAPGSGVIFGWLKVPQEIFSESRQLMWIYAGSLIPTFMCSICNSVLNGMGASKSTMIISVMGQILNIALDLIAVAGLGFGVKGAAWASFISVVFALTFTYIHMEKMLDKLAEKSDGLDNSCMKKYIPLAIPSIIQQSIFSVGNLILEVLVNVAGVAYINGYNVANTISGLFSIFIIASCTGFETFAAQNIGAKKYDRVGRGFKGIIIFGIALCLILSGVTLLCQEPLISFYLTDKTGTAFTFAQKYMILLIPNYFFILGKYSVDGFFKAQLKVYLFTVSSFISLVLRVMFGYMLEPVCGLWALAIAASIGNAVAMVFDWVCVFADPKNKCYWRMTKPHTLDGTLLQ